MEWQDLYNIAAALVAALGGSLFAIFWNAIKTLQRNYLELIQIISRDYIRKDDYRDDMAEIRTMFHRILDKLDSKMDKE